MFPYLIAGAIGFVVAKLTEKDEPKYEDGGSVLLAPNGEPSNLTPEQYKLVRTPAFKKWFGDWENDPANSSKVVDSNGEPLVVYHGTYVENPFYVFDFKKADIGFHFGTYEQAKNRSETKLFFEGHKSIVNSFFLNIKTIFETSDIGEWEYPQRYIDMFVSDGLISESDAKKNGFYRMFQREDNTQIREYLLAKYGEFVGFIYNNKHEGLGKSFIVLNHSQIKLADGSNTTFDGSNPDIRFDDGGNVNTNSFEKWFNKSKVVDKKGNPLIVYHGSPDLRGLREKYIFESRFADNQSFFFTDNYSMAKSYADPKNAFDYQNAEEGVIGLYLSLQNPLIVNAFNQIWRKFEITIDGNEIIGTRNLIKFAKDKGYDGVIVENVRDYYNNNENKTKGGNVYVAFEPNQIKLADGTNTTFDGNNPDIRYAGGGEVFYHGSTDKNLEGKKGIHIGTKLASTQALESRIGVPSKGEWDGKREYGKTLLAGKKRLKELEKQRGYSLTTGFNSGRDIPEEDYYPTERKERAVYSDGTPIPFNSKPIVFPVKITGRMTNSKYSPHTDDKANSMMLRNLKMGNAKSGYYYVNIGEDEGSISAVVPDKSFIEIIHNNPDIRYMAGGKVDVVDIKQYNIGKINYRFVEIAEKKYNKIELYRQADDGNYYGHLLYRRVPKYDAEFSSPMVNDINQLYAFEPVSNKELFNAVKNKKKPFASMVYWMVYNSEEEIQKEIQSFIDECDKYDLEYSVDKISGENSNMDRIQFQVCQKGTFDELFDINALIEDYTNNDFDSYDIEKLEEFRYVDLSYFLNNEWDEHYALTGLILGIPPKFTMALINMGTTYGLAKKYDYTENVFVIKNNNSDIRFDDGGEINNYKEFFDNLEIEDGSKYIGMKFGDVFPYLKGRRTPNDFRIYIKQYRGVLKRLKENKYTLSSMRNRDLNKLKRMNNEYLEKKLYLSKFNLDSKGNITSFQNM